MSIPSTDKAKIGDRVKITGLYETGGIGVIKKLGEHAGYYVEFSDTRWVFIYDGEFEIINLTEEQILNDYSID